MNKERWRDGRTDGRDGRKGRKGSTMRTHAYGQKTSLDARIFDGFPYSVDRSRPLCRAICCLAIVCLAPVWSFMLIFNSYLPSDDALSMELRRPLATELAGLRLQHRTVESPIE